MFYYEKEPISIYLQNLEKLATINSSKQNIELFNHIYLGKVLIINGEIQHIEKYQSLYHEMLVHLPIAFIPNVKNVLIIGGGSLFAAFEALKYSSVESVTLCDHDHYVLDLMAKYYSHAKYVLQSPKFMLIEKDAHDFLIEDFGTYDLIINDCFNLAMEGKRKNISYYNILSSHLTPTGVCSDITYRHIFDEATMQLTLKQVSRESYRAYSLVTVPEYPGILHLQVIWGKSDKIRSDISIPVNDIQRDVIMRRKPFNTEFYMPTCLPYYLHIPNYVKKLFNKI